MIQNNQKGAVGPLELVLVLVLLGAIGFTVWRVTTADVETGKASQSAIEASDAQLKLSTLPDSLEGLKPLKEIQDTADLGGSTIISIELEQADGGLVYKLWLADGTILVFDARTGEQLSNETGEASENDALPSDFLADISPSDAISIAKKARPNSKVKKVELEVEDGKVIWSVRFTDDGRVSVDATTGKAIRVTGANNEDESTAGSEDQNEDSTNHGADDKQDDSHDDSDGDHDDSGDDDQNDDGDQDDS